MQNKIPYQVGLTGGLGSGKSTVARIFSVLGVPVYESDFWAKKLYFRDEIKTQVISLLGQNAYKSDRQIDSSWIAETIYAQPELRQKLNQILHPAVALHYENWLAIQQYPYILKVAALIFEASIHEKMDLNLLVTSPLELRKIRVLRRDSQRNLQQIENIVNAQWTDEAKRNLADGEIVNDEKHSLVKQVFEWNSLILNKL